MRILLSESMNKSVQTVCDVSKEDLLKLIENDIGCHEVIPMMDPSVHVRIYFDVDVLNKSPEEILKTSLSTINGLLKTTDDEWAISDGSRQTEKGFKSSFHILSKYHTLSIQELRNLAERINTPLKKVDPTVYWFKESDRREQGFFRFPNQSKGSIQKEGIPMKIIQGELKDFLITDIELLSPL